MSSERAGSVRARQSALYCSGGLQFVRMRGGSWDAPVKRSAALPFWMGGSIREDRTIAW